MLTQTTGFVSIVGAGAGDPDLITVKALRRLREADVVLYDYLANPLLLKECRPEAELMDVSKHGDGGRSTPQATINALLVTRGKAGLRVVRLKGGDPFIFGRGGEEALALQAEGIPFEIVPGISSAIAVPAYAGIPVTHRGVAASVTIVTGHEAPDKEGSSLNYEALAKGADTLVFLMAVGNLERISSELIQHGRAATTPAAVVRWGTVPEQKVIEGTLETIAAKVREANLKPPAVLVIGEVVRLRESLRWFDLETTVPFTTTPPHYPLPLYEG